MEYLLSVSILAILVLIYVILYRLNSKMKINCNLDECEGCNFMECIHHSKKEEQ